MYQKYKCVMISLPPLLPPPHTRCIHCQHLEPHFAAAARRLLANDPPVLLGRVKLPDQLEVAKRFGVSGYPLLFMFRHGRTYNYTGPREEDGMGRREIGMTRREYVDMVGGM